MSENKPSKKTHGKIYYSFPLISTLPLLIYGIIILIVGSFAFSHAMYAEVQTGLQNSVDLINTLLDMAYPGDYTLQNLGTDDSPVYRLYKGDADITDNNNLLDDIKEKTGMEITLFYMDTRILTTIRNWNQARLVGISAPEIVYSEVFEGAQPRFYRNALIYGETYFAYYTPLYNSDGSVAGILCVGKPTAEVQSMVHHSLYPLIAVGVLTMIVTGIFSFTYARHFVSALHKLKKFFTRVSTGSLHEQLDEALLRKNDELSEIGYAALSMQRSLRNLVEMDSLTGLYNRRHGEKMLQNTRANARKSDSSFTIAIGDIDFFKKINDTYGHESGDIVLRAVSDMLKTHVHGIGYAIRWGGEEFLLIYEKLGLEEARAELERLMERLRTTLHHVDGQDIHVTMTFGMRCDPTLNTETLIRQADDNLYIGKEQGRDRIISQMPRQTGDQLPLYKRKEDKV